MDAPSSVGDEVQSVAAMGAQMARMLKSIDNISKKLRALERRVALLEGDRPAQAAAADMAAWRQEPIYLNAHPGSQRAVHAEELSEAVFREDSTDVIEEAPGRFRCMPCNRWVDEAHIRGRGHQEMLENQLRQPRQSHPRELPLGPSPAAPRWADLADEGFPIPSPEVSYVE